jgi:hypothetical protein
MSSSCASNLVAPIAVITEKRGELTSIFEKPWHNEETTAYLTGVVRTACPDLAATHFGSSRIRQSSQAMGALGFNCLLPAINAISSNSNLRSRPQPID